MADLEKAKGKCPCGEALSETLTYLVKWWPRQAPVWAEIEKDQSDSLCPFSFQRKAESREEITKVVVAIHVRLTRSLFGDDILRGFLPRVSLAKPTSAPLRF